jgi:hypothetical protein
VMMAGVIVFAVMRHPAPLPSALGNAHDYSMGGRCRARRRTSVVPLWRGR